MNSKYIRKASTILFIVEIICLLTFLKFEINKLSFYNIIIIVFGTMFITLIVVVMLSIQIKRTWLRVGDTAGKIVNWFWLFGSCLGILTIVVNVLESKKEIVIFIPIFVAVLFTTIYWGKYMYGNNVYEIKKKIEKERVKKNNKKIKI